MAILAFDILLLLLLLLNYSTFSSADLLSQSCGGDNYTANSTFQLNLSNLLTFFASLDNYTSFITHAKGAAPNRAYGLILCRGDVRSSECSHCIQNAAQDALSICSQSKQATLWYIDCELRYSDLQFFSTFQNSNSRTFYNRNNITNHVDEFIQVQRRFLDELTYQAAYNSSLMFATGTVVNGSDIPKVNGLAQCTRDLSMNGCSRCLQQIREVFTEFDLEASQGGRVLGESCNFRYEVYPFFQGKPIMLLNLTTSPPSSSPPPLVIMPVPTPSATTAAGQGSKNHTRKVLAIVIALLVFVMLIVAISIFVWRKRTKRNIIGMANLEEISSVESLLFDLSTLKIATDNFSEVNKLGEGGFGSVYKGKLEHGQEIAVKRLSTSSTQGLQELKNEVFLVAKVQHINLVRLLGVCLEEEEKLLVYEYVPNGSLDNILFDPTKCKQLTWERRFNIIGGIARGLFYLHEESHLKVIHGDLKASNILLDSDMNPKISDFGLARLFGGDETQGTTSRVVGTFGYMAPEYVLHGHWSTKVDVFSYGVLALEIATGRKSISCIDPENEEDFLDHIWKHWSSGTVLEIIDPSLENCSKNEVLRCIHLALLCVQEMPAERPPMSAVVLMLHSPSVPLQAPSQPGFFHGMINSNTRVQVPSGLGPSDGFANGSLQISVNDVSITEMQPSRHGIQVRPEGDMTSQRLTDRVTSLGLF